jgi:hypothetical protein
VEKEVPLLKRASKLASGMLKQDGSWAFALYALLTIPSLIAFWKDSFTLQEGVYLQAVERGIQLIVLYVVGKRWVTRFQQPAATPRSMSLPMLFGIGFFLWSLLPLAALLYSIGTPLTQLVSPLLAIPAVVCAFVYYFYFFPIALGTRSLRGVHDGALRFIQNDRLLPLKAMLGPLALMLLVLNALAIISPDGDIAAVGFLRACAGGMFFLLSTYLAYAIGFLVLGNKEWRQLEFDPYRVARFTTLELQGSSLLARLLEPKNGLKVLLVAILIGLGNMAVQASLPPTAELTITQVELTEDAMTLVLQARDPEQHFRTFLPPLLSVAGPEGQAVTSDRQPNEIRVNGQPYDPLSSGIPDGTVDIEISLTFKTTRSAENMKRLEDLHLWYRSAKLALIPMQDATILEGTAASEKDSREVEREKAPATPEGAN